MRGRHSLVTAVSAALAALPVGVGGAMAADHQPAQDNPRRSGSEGAQLVGIDGDSILEGASSLGAYVRVRWKDGLNRAAGVAPAASEVFGCHTDTWAPSFVFNGVLQGPIDFTACINIAWTDASVCLDYGGPLQACSTTRRYGNVVWTAWSGAYGCPANRPIRSWRTVGALIHFHSVGGHDSYWGTSSPYRMINC
ncbi:hypothetical protein Gocc_2518 [Gaiella occulta]|uniref:Secreted protein n=1 Tax=Gaiella occulta TaxID=1002870 RepID=A0A7M2YVN9_9ACTN|nr:hypothetical protein Gocc_2518 [Gaiella occulta]